MERLWGAVKLVRMIDIRINMDYYNTVKNNNNKYIFSNIISKIYGDSSSR
jgi:hypothetical protein